jgi:DNA-binding LacI/PurR family transcriptional regulator
MARPTRDDVARHAQVSGATVSRVLSGKGDLSIAEETRVRVLAAARRIGYQPNAAARALVTGRTGIVGFWMCLGYSRYRAHVVNRMQQVLTPSEFAIAITDVEEELSRRHTLSRALRLGVDGIIAFDTPTAGGEFARSQAASSGAVPFVSMGAYWTEATNFVGVDLYAGATDAMRHLIATGRRRIAYLHPEISEEWAKEDRYNAYCAALQEAGYEPHFITTPDVSLATAWQRVREHLQDSFQSSPRPDAILCHNDDMAVGAYRALCDLGLRPGADIALIGCDGIEETEYLSCPLTTIKQPIDQMCTLAWQYLHAAMENPGGPLQQCVLKPELVIRSSTSH